VARAANYTNAGTVEFLVDAEKNFYFLEMNTRLQVEHPVTELITGLDLVHLQILIASGCELPFRQEDLSIRGHAIECRIYAEDPDNHFFPSPGKITMLLPPAGPGIRHDSGSYEGWTVPIEYDPLLAKLIAYGSDRKQATMRLQRALQEYFVGGIKTNVSLFQRILRDPDFLAARLDTGYLERLLAQAPELRALAPHSSAGEQSVEVGSEVAAIAAALFAVLDPAAARNGTSPVQDAVADGSSDRSSVERSSNWKRAALREALRN
jgi:acetyl-CoA carboxylase biotin carboxylase subunit